jgi:tetratricopeptide (TPR) repeat protein
VAARRCHRRPADPKTARDAYRRAVELQPDNAEAQLWHGWLEKEGGGLAAADAAFCPMLALAERGAASDAEAMWARLGIGDVLVARGELGAALKSYRNAFATTERLATADPGNAGWQRDLSVSHERIGDVLRAQGNLTAALESYQASLAIAERLAAADPGNAGCGSGTFRSRTRGSAMCWSHRAT